MFMFTWIFSIYVYVHMLHVFYGLVWFKKKLQKKQKQKKVGHRPNDLFLDFYISL
jgi:hypothetical protein